MESVFDRLAREISRDERRSMLMKIGDTQDLNEEPMRLDDASTGQHVVLDREFAELSFFARIRIILIGIFTGRSRHKMTEEYLLHKIQRKVERASPGLIDYHRELVSPKMYQSIAKLRSAMDVFRRPLVRAMEGDKPDFYALLGRLEFEDIKIRLENEPDPEKLSNVTPDALPVEIKRQMDSIFDGIMEDIVPDRRRRMSAHTVTLARLKTLVRYPYERILNLFPPGEQSAGGPASLRKLKDPLLELGDALHAFKSPPSTTLLETMFLFELQDRISDSEDRLELELTERMDRAAAALDIVRKINSEIPWTNLLKTLAEDIQYAPRPVAGGDDWFRVFKKFWRERLMIKYHVWYDRKRLSEILRGLTVLWGLDLIPPVPGYRGVEFPDNIQPRHESSFAAVRTLFLDIFQGRLYHALNLVKIDGKFYKKDNRREYDEVFGRFLKIPDKIRGFENRLRPDGEYGIRHAELRREASIGEDTVSRLQDLIIQLDRESQNIVLPLIGDLKAMARLLKGILAGNGGSYDTLSNMAEIGGQGNSTFRINLQEVLNIVDNSSNLLTDLFDLEEKRSLS
ncbi:MAG: hypothetical protein J7L76_02575 [Spirochaetaceae bacterium]|nr:hypothetical protein [Spirochaetaceae bacterium]RKX74181.1 MAG: hypothetical protein DRP49_06365 [Spirochaetota bacterium]